MKKTLTANIGGTVFHIEEDAYERLQRYLTSIRAQFAGSESAAEIMADIEARIAELFTQRTDERKVVNLDDVEQVIGVMGQPEDYVGEEVGAGSGKSASGERQGDAGAGTGRKYKRLFRDTEDKWAGGVCAGVAHFFGIDPLIVRLVLAVLLIPGFGTPLLIYAIMWIIVPPADSAAEKLEMQGEPVTVDNIKRMFEEGAEHFKKQASGSFKGASDQFTKGAERMDRELKDLGKRAYTGSGSMGSRLDTSGVKHAAQGFFGFIGEMLRLFIRFMGKFFGAVLLLFGAVAAMVLAVVLIGRYDLLFTSGTTIHSIGLHEWTDLVFLSPGQANWAWAAAVVFILVPVIGLLYGGISLLFDVTGPRWMAWALGPVWIVSIIVLTAIGVRVASDLRVPEEMGSEHVLATPADNKLIAVRLDPRSDAFSWQARYRHGRIEMNSDIDLDGDSVRWNDAELDVQRSPDSLFHLVVFRSARGATSTAARDRAAGISTEWSQNDSLLALSSAYRSGRTGKLRMQQVRYLLLVPLGGSVHLDQSLGNMPDDIKNTTDTWDTDMLGRTWTMTAKGLEDANAARGVKKDATQEQLEKEEMKVKELMKEQEGASTSTEGSRSSAGPFAATVFRGPYKKRPPAPAPSRAATFHASRATVGGDHPGILDLVGRVITL